MGHRTIVDNFFSAFRGIKHALRGRAFAIQITLGILALALAQALKVSHLELVIIVLLIAFVLATEAINTACERTLDLITREHNPEVARIKEILAGAVLIYSLAAVIAGILIFGNALFS